MRLVKCKNDTEKVTAIREYCENAIAEIDRNIYVLKNLQEGPLDYADEIHVLQVRKAEFEVIIRIATADEYTSIMVVH